MKFVNFGMAGVGALLAGLVLTSTVMAAVPTDNDRRPGVENRGPGPGNRDARLERRRGGSPEQQIGRMDTNDDGKVSVNEFVDARLTRTDQLFERMDRNKDGLISLEEDQRPQRPDRGRRPARRAEVLECVRATIPDFSRDAGLDIEERFEEMDGDANGSVTLSELSAALEANARETFADIDDDDDGFITGAELEAQRQAQREGRQALRSCARKTV